MPDGTDRMARYKHIDTSPRFLAVDLQRQLLPGTFEHALNHLIDQELDLSSFDARFRNGRRFATVEPVFGNLRHNKQLNRFTLRSQQKVDAQWKLYCLVHNIEKLAHHGYAQ